MRNIGDCTLGMIAWGLLSGCHIPPPRIDDLPSIARAQITVDEGRLVVSTPGAGEPGLVLTNERVFRDWTELWAFAEREMAAKPVYGSQGEIVGMYGEIVQVGEILFLGDDGRAFRRDDFAGAYLGGRTGQLRVGEDLIDFVANTDSLSDVVVFAMSAETCDGPDCVYGESWVTHWPETPLLTWLGSYHSVGAKTVQSKGGMGSYSYTCCRPGAKLVGGPGQQKCIRKRAGAWEYDHEEGRLVAIGDDPYVTEATRTCSGVTRFNRLRVDVGLVFGPQSVETASAEASNTDEVKLESWLIGKLIDLQAFGIDDVVGVCGTHWSNRGGSARTSDGETFDLCESR